MLAHTSLLANGSLFIGAFGVALLGSAHCVGMCGGLAAAVKKNQTPYYHLGRGLSYTIMGTTMGGLGSGIFRLLKESPVALLSISVVFFVILLLQAALIWRGVFDSTTTVRAYRKVFLKWVAPAMNRYSMKSNAFMFGVSSAFVPCGWILTFSWSAAATGSVLRGGLIFLALWLGTLPALLAASSFFTFLRKRFTGSFGRRLTAASILVLSLGSLWNRIAAVDSALLGENHHADVYCLPKK